MIRKWGLLLIVMAIMLSSANAEESRVIAYTVYEQSGWGDRVCGGFVLEDGEIWTFSGSTYEIGWPSALAERPSWMQSTDSKEMAGILGSDERFILNSLVHAVSAQEGKSASWFCDAGTESSYAIQYNREGQSTQILLGMTGDFLFENRDENAQSIYARLRAYFPSVRSFFLSAQEIDWGFHPVPLAEFCQLQKIDWAQVKARGYKAECEEGLVWSDYDDEASSDMISMLQSYWLTGKENSLFVTGGTTGIALYDSNDNWITSVEFYDGLLVTGDGMYSLEIRRKDN